MGRMEDAHCIHCRVKYTDSMLYEICTKTYLQQSYFRHRQEILVNRERANLPGLQIAALERRQRRDNYKLLSDIKKHIKELSEKEYTELYGINAPDYVLMFVPIEAALLIAFNENNKLYLEAFDKNVVLVSTSTLLATLSTVSSIWKQEDQKRNVIEIARQAGALYDKFVGLVEDLTGVGKKLDAAKNEYSSAMNKLVDGRGNLITSVEKIKKLGAKAKKSIPEQILLRSKEED